MLLTKVCGMHIVDGQNVVSDPFTLRMLCVVVILRRRIFPRAIQLLTAKQTSSSASTYGESKD